MNLPRHLTGFPPVWLVLVALALSGCCWANQSAQAEDGIVVMGSGEILAKPDKLQFDIAASGSAELGSDALVKYRQTLKRTLEAFEALKIDSLKIEQRGLAAAAGGGMNLQQPGIADGEGPLHSNVVMSRRVRLVVSGIGSLSEDDLSKTMARLLDTAKDMHSVESDPNSGQPVMAHPILFVVSDVDRLSTTAYQQAVERRARAEQLAKLADVKLGSILAIEESVDTNSVDQNRMTMLNSINMYAMSADFVQNTQPGGDRIVTDSFEPVSIRVNLRVRFAVQSRGNP